MSIRLKTKVFQIAYPNVRLDVASTFIPEEDGQVSLDICLYLEYGWLYHLSL